MIGSNTREAIPLAWVPRGAYIGPPLRDTMVIRLGAGPSHLSLRPPSSPPTAGARRLAGPADRPGTIAVLLMTLAWSWGHGDSAAIWRTITVAIPRLVWLMACGARGRGWLTPVSRLPTGPSCDALTVFCTPTGGWVPPSLGHIGSRHGHSVPPTEAEVRAGMATVPRHDGDIQRYGVL